MIKIINLKGLKLKTFTEQNASDYCQINNINPDNIIELDLRNNELIDISGIKIFKNLKQLNLTYNNKIENIFPIQYLKNLEILNIINLKLESNQLQYIQSLKNLVILHCSKGFKDMKVLKQLNKNITIIL